MLNLISTVAVMNDHLVVGHAHGDIFVISMDGDVINRCQYPDWIKAAYITKLVVHPSGTQFASLIWNQVLCWNADGTFLHQKMTEGFIHDIAYAKDGTLLVLDNDGLRHFADRRDAVEYLDLRYSYRTEDLQIVSSHTIVGCRKDLNQVNVINNQGIVASLSCSGSGRKLLSANPLPDGRIVVNFSNEPSFQIWDSRIPEGAGVHTFRAPICQREWKLSAGGELFSFASIGPVRRAYKWDWDTGQNTVIGDVPEEITSNIAMTFSEEAFISVDRQSAIEIFRVHRFPFFASFVWCPNIEFHGLMPAPFRAAVVAVLSLTLENPRGGRRSHENWFQIPPELTCLVFEFLASTLRISIPTPPRFALEGRARPGEGAPGGAAGADDVVTPKIGPP